MQPQSISVCGYMGMVQDRGEVGNRSVRHDRVSEPDVNLHRNTGVFQRRLKVDSDSQVVCVFLDRLSSRCFLLTVVKHPTLKRFPSRGTGTWLKESRTEGVTDCTIKEIQLCSLL